MRLMAVGLLIVFVAGCHRASGNIGQVQSYAILASEPEWIRNGEPIVFEGEKWYPQDGTDGLQDAEVLLLGEYRGVSFFIDKEDVRPYKRLYTKFGRNKFRYFELKQDP